MVLAALATVWCAAGLTTSVSAAELWQLSIVSAAVVLLTVTGLLDDIYGLPMTPRLVAQGLAAAMIIATLPMEVRIVAGAPLWLERLGILVVGIWFINLVNFMDGIDWMTVAEVVPIAGAIAVLGVLGAVPMLQMLIALALLGAVAGFAPFNKPVARLFLGDVGSLPIGLTLLWLLLMLVANRQCVAALLLPLYYLADATLTLFRRMIQREPFWWSHRTHFYQRASDNGFSVPAIVAMVFAVNVALAALALISVKITDPAISTALLGTGAALVALVLSRFSRPRRRPA